MPALSEILRLLAPWEISPLAIALCVGGAYAYGRGLARMPAGLRPGIGRRIAFFAGLAAIYFVMQTRFDFLSQHMFYIHRLQHLVLHHLAPFLIALSMPLAALAAGTPRLLARPIEGVWRSAPAQRAYRLLQNGFVAPVLFVGLIWFWLNSRVHFYAMLSEPLYWLMNWTMLLDGLLFWILVMDPRTRREGALLGLGPRVFIVLAAAIPQIVIGAHITLASEDLYDVYAVCGRAWDIDPLIDQRTGGLITWIPAAMMHAIAGVMLIGRWARADARRASEAAAAGGSA